MMSGFKYRSDHPELLDNPSIPEIQLHQNLRELDSINRLLGGHSVTIEGIKRILKPGQKSFSVTDIGCGGGDTLLAIHLWAVRNNLTVKLKGIDILPGAVTFASEKLKETNAEILQGDIHTIKESDITADVVCCNMVCHHLYDRSLELMIKRMYECAKIGIVINDLHRHPFAFYGIKTLTGLFSRSVLVKNDAPLSVKKGFRYDELNALLDRVGLVGKVRWKWAFRYLITVRK